MSTAEACTRIQLILSDVDGVLSEGRVVFDSAGVESKAFHIRDGLGIKLWQRAGGRFGIVTGRESPVVARRAEELGVDIVHQGVGAKLPVVAAEAERLGLTLDEVCYIGDDLPDLPPILRVGLGAAVADAAFEVREAAGYVTDLPGGCGAVRELIEYVLKQSGRWDAVLAEYLGVGEAQAVG
ncbi:MAG: HAD hydrolase family protein [Planctomycetota bacterium]